MSLRTVIGACGIAAALAVGLRVVFAPDETPSNAFVPGARSVVVAPATLRELEDRIEALGTTASWESIDIRPSVTETVGEIRFTDGQQVTRGAVLVTLVQQEEQAKLTEAQSFLAEQEREVRRIESLVARKSLPANQLDERRTLRDVALARVAAARAALDDRTIRAPFDGVLGLRGASVGALVSPQTVITTLDDIASLRLDFPVPSLLLGSLRPGQVVSATSPAVPGRSFSGEVTGIDSRVNPVDRSVVVRARLDNRDLALKPGMLMNVLVQTARRTALVVPEESLTHYQREHYVLKVDAANGNRTVRVDVEVGQRIPGFVEIVQGLSAGDSVITEGITSVRPGDVVVPRAAEAKP